MSFKNDKKFTVQNTCFFLIIIVIFLFASMILSGCSASKKADTKPSGQPKVQKEDQGQAAKEVEKVIKEGGALDDELEGDVDKVNLDYQELNSLEEELSSDELDEDLDRLSE